MKVKEFKKRYNRDNYTDKQVINEVLENAIVIFTRDTLIKELDELLDDGKKLGIELCPKCGFVHSGECKNI